MPSAIRLHRVLRATPKQVYQAFLDPDAKAKWLPPHGSTGKVHHMDAHVGGTYKMSFTNFATGQSHSFGGEYLELVPHERICHTDKFDDPSLPGEMQVSITLKDVSCGTEVTITQDGVPDMIPAEACYLGWQVPRRYARPTGQTRRGARRRIGPVRRHHRLCYMRGPEGILIGLAEELGRQTS